MLKKLLFVSMITLALSCCKKDNKKSWHLHAKFNGTTVDFSPSLVAEKGFDPVNGYIISVLGMGGNSSNPLPSFDFYYRR